MLYWFTSSTCFAGLAVTIGRILTDTCTGIVSVSAPTFIAAQIAATLSAHSWRSPSVRSRAGGPLQLAD